MPTSQVKSILKRVANNKQLPPVPDQNTVLSAGEDANPYTPRNCPPYSPRSKFHPTGSNRRPGFYAVDVDACNWFPPKRVKGSAVYATRLHSSPEQEPQRLPHPQGLSDRRDVKIRIQGHDVPRTVHASKWHDRLRAAQAMATTSTKNAKSRARRNAAYGRGMSLSTSSSSSHSATRGRLGRSARAGIAIVPVKALTIKKKTRGDEDHPQPQMNLVTPRSHLQRKKRVTKRGSISDTDHDVVQAGSRAISKSPREFNAKILLLEDKKAKRRSRVHEQPGTIHNLPLILSGDQAYECLVQWEEEKEEIDNAEQLWRQLEHECGVDSPRSNNLRNQRGRWKIKVVETPVLKDTVYEDIKQLSSPHWAEDPNDNQGLSSPFSGVLREVEGLLPSITTYDRLSSAIAHRRPTRRRSTRPRRWQNRPAVHAHVKQIIQGIWDEFADEEAEVWCREMMRLHTLSRSRSKMSRSQSRRPMPNGHNQSCDMNMTASLKFGLGITMERSVTLKSMGEESLIDLYTWDSEE